MPHKCVKCGKIYHEGYKELTEGCTCGGKLFFVCKRKNRFHRS